MTGLGWFAAFIGGLLGGALSRVVSSWIDSLFASHSRKENEKDALLSEIDNTLSSCLEKIEEYWHADQKTLGPRGAVLESQIVPDLHHLIQLCGLLFSTNEHALNDTRLEWKALHHLSTGGQFQEPDRTSDAAIASAVRRAAFQMKRGVGYRRREMPREFLAR